MNKPTFKMTKAQLKKERECNKMLAEVNDILNRRISLACLTGNNNGLVRHLVAAPFRFRLQPTYSPTFYNPHSFLAIAAKYGYSFFISVEKNLDGIDAPVLNFYPESDDEGNC